MINFYCPLGQSPNGGHKVIYETVESLNLLGVESQVLHPIKGYKINWIDSSAKVNKNLNIKYSDYFMIPEVCLSFISEYKINLNSKYSIIVLNGYLVFEGDNSILNIRKFYEDCEYIFCISEDTKEIITMLFPDLYEKILIFEPSMNRFYSEDLNNLKSKVISYMPRKNPLYSNIVINLIKPNLPNEWEIIAIHGQSESKVINLLKESKIFLNFAGLEGYGLPPLEAAILGNIVIGNHGNGAKFFWKNPLFINVSKDDLKLYAEKTLDLVNKIENARLSTEDYESHRLDLIAEIKKREALPTVISKLDLLKNKVVKNQKNPLVFRLSVIKYLIWRLNIKFSKFKNLKSF